MAKPKTQLNSMNLAPTQKGEIWVVLADIRSRENVGSIFRTADAAGVSKIFLCGITPQPPHDKISKTALGAEETVPWEYHSQAWRLLQNFKKLGLEIIVLEQTSESKNIFNYYKNGIKNGLDKNGKKGKIDPQNLSLKEERFNPKIKYKNITVLVLGNEVTGIPQKLLNYTTKLLHIPMYGTKESLNVAVAFGIAVYALRGK